jgi:GrpB-like predicted nucleotidyltransferase (UPF0157 family)
MRVEVVPYNRQWSLNFDQLKTSIEAALDGVDYTSIEHVGSTAVPELCAKPIIDIDVIVATEADVKPAIEALSHSKDANYTFAGEMGIPGRYVMLDRETQPRHNLYICLDGCVALRNHLGVRKVLREDKGLRDEYATVKLILAAKELEDMDEYVEGKSEVLQKILWKAGLSAEEADGIKENNKRDFQSQFDRSRS